MPSKGQSQLLSLLYCDMQDILQTFCNVSFIAVCLLGTYLHPALLALAIITVGRFQAVILVDSIAILIEGLVLV
jgi:hypothetical protein